MAAPNQAPVRVWDLPVRLFHWLLVLLFAFMFLSGKLKGGWMDWHMRAGYAVLALVCFRVMWGFAGSTYARFGSFVASPTRCLAYARKLASGAPAPSAGHNPLGGWMVLLLLAALLLQAAAGLFANDDISIEGPLAALVSKATSDRLTGFHYWNAGALLLLVAIHAAAVLFHWLVRKEDLIGAMFTGVKRLPMEAAREAAAVRFVSTWRALLLLLVAAFVVFVIVNRPF